MGDQRTAWHPGFAAYIEGQSPPGTVVESEVVIAHQQRADLILIRKASGLGFPTWILCLNERGDAVGRALLGFFGSRSLEFLDAESRGWLQRRYLMSEVSHIEDLPDYEDLGDTLATNTLFAQLFRRRMKTMPVDELLRELLVARGREGISEEELARLREVLEPTHPDSGADSDE